MDNDGSIKKIKEIYSDFRLKLGDIFNKKKILLKTYRSKIEEAKIKEVKESLNNLSK
jgi:hypothetical protein